MVTRPSSWLTALPVFNEARHLDCVLAQVRQYSANILVVDDGSTDATPELLAKHSDVRVVTHNANQGYGAALRSAFQYARENGYGVLVTIDCDGQHQPQRIPRFVSACQNFDIVSGSRYLRRYSGDTEPPPARQWINQQITAELNQRLGLQLTDAFCGFKAYRVDVMAKLDLHEDGYAMPLELWAQAVLHDLKIVELPVPLIYLDEARSFGGALDDPRTRLDHYHEVMDRSIAAAELTAKHRVHRCCDGGMG